MNAKNIAHMDYSELSNLHKEMLARYNEFLKRGLKLDMSRGKPSAEQVSLSSELLYMPGDYGTVIDGAEAGNYGILDGLPACRKLFADVLGVTAKQVFMGGSSSLNLMYDTIAKAFTHGLLHSEKPWSKHKRVKFICITPGYDRHFAICESFGMEMLSVPMTPTGPDMDMVEDLVRDKDVRGIWCVPKYSNPCGTVYSDETIHRIAALKPAAEDFIVMWDNAYCVHDITDNVVSIPEILSLCAKYGNADMVFEFASTSKITFPGGGVSCFACSEANIAYMKKLYGVQTISFDKLNQLRHTLFFKNADGLLRHMKLHAEVLRPKFEIVLKALNDELSGLGAAEWNTPKGGYFVSVKLLPGLAKRVRLLCLEAGLVMTEAGATYPYGNDPNDSDLRIAPSFPPNNELTQAAELFCICVKLAAAEKFM